MPHFSDRSLRNLEGVHPYLTMVLHYGIDHIDFSVASGVRSTKEQQDLYARGRTEPGPIVTHIDGLEKKSNHQINEQTCYGHAVDIYPYPADDLRSLEGSAREKALRRFVGLSFFIKGIWSVMKTEGALDGSLRWGGDWDSDFDFNDQSFDDLPHLELVFEENNQQE